MTDAKDRQAVERDMDLDEKQSEEISGGATTAEAVMSVSADKKLQAAAESLTVKRGLAEI